MSTVQLDLPAFVQRDVDAIARRDGVSPEQLMVIAIAEKVTAMRVAEQMGGAEMKELRRRFLQILDKVPDVAPIPGDEIPPELAAKLKARRARRSAKS